MLTVWGRSNAFNVQKVLWLLAELNLPYQHIVIGGSYGSLNTPQFLALNPHGKIPVLQDADRIIWESHAILHYLAAQYGQSTLWPQDAGVRSESDRWLDWFQTSLQPAFLTNIFWAFYRTPEAQRDWAVIQQGIRQTASYIQLLDKQLADKDYLTGAELSLADIAVGTLLYRYFNVDVERTAAPHVDAWYQRLLARPAYQQHVAIAFDDLYGRLA